MPEDNSQWVKRAAIVAGCTVVAAGATYFVYRQLSKPQKATPESFKELGNTYFQQKNYQEAVKTFDEALKLAGNDPNLKDLRSICHQNAAACLEKLDRLPEAILRCSEAIVLRPQYLKALIRRGSLHASLGENEECLRDFALVSMIDPQSKMLEKVFNIFEKANQKLAEAEMAEIMLHRQQGIDFPIPETSVLEWLAYSVTKDPVVEGVKNLHAVEDRYDSILSLIKHKKYDLKVKEWVDKFYEFYGMLDDHAIQSENIKSLMIAVYNIQAQTADNLEEAQTYVDKAKEIDPTNTDVYFGYTSLAVLNRDLAKAKEALEHVLEIDKDHPYVKFFLTHFEFTKACEESHMANIHNVILKMEQLLDQLPKAPIFTYTVLSN
uniref:Mitochondrial import receptor subunit TOM70 n=1 Tax=Panagrolaimus sp. JU765 TaxID=591449 RepID=A0AC34RGG9_9BILA